MNPDSKEALSKISHIEASSSAYLGSNRPGLAHARPWQAKATWSSLFAFTRPAHVRVLVVAIVASGATTALRTALAVFLGRIFEVIAAYDSGLWSGPTVLEAVSKWCLVLLGLGLANWLANAAFLALWIVFGELQADSARRHVFGSMLTHHLAWFDVLDQGIPGLLVRIKTYATKCSLTPSTEDTDGSCSLQTDTRAPGRDLTSLWLPSLRCPRRQRFSRYSAVLFVEAGPGTARLPATFSRCPVSRHSTA